jgi:tRNA(Ile)-lysidine synthetase-like protein
VRPSFDEEILDLSTRAARVRRETERLASRYIVARDADAVDVSAPALVVLAPESLGLLWPAFVAHLRVPLDRRGVARATDFSLRSRPGQQAQCGGGITLERTATTIRVRRVPDSIPATVELGSAVEFGVWSLRRVSLRAFRTHVARSGSRWAAALRQPAHLLVRAWQPGDRVWANGLRSPRRVKRYFSERAIPVSERKSWPVVVSEGGIVWVPGICEAAASSEKLGPPLTYMICERRVG